MRGMEYTDVGTDYTTWQVMQEYMPRQLLLDFSKKFQTFDPEKTGLVTTEDMVVILKSMGRNVSTEQIRAILYDLTGGDYRSSRLRYVDFKEYVSVMSVLVTDCIPEDEMFLVFRQFDRDGDGFISSAELRDLLQRLGDEITDDDLEAMMKEADLDGDGKVSYNEFIRVMTNSVDGSDSTAISSAPANSGPTVSTIPVEQIAEQGEQTVASDSEEESDDIIAAEQSSARVAAESPPRTRSFSLGSYGKPQSSQSRSSHGHRRKVSLGEFFHVSAASRRRNSRQSCPDIATSKHHHHHQSHESKLHEDKPRRFSLSGSAAHLLQLFKRKKHH